MIRFFTLILVVVLLCVVACEKMTEQPLPVMYSALPQPHPATPSESIADSLENSRQEFSELAEMLNESIDHKDQHRPNLKAVRASDPIRMGPEE